jgi:hypothetical protein
MIKASNWDAPSRIPKTRLGEAVSSDESNAILKRLEEHFGYNQTYIHWVGTYCKELGDMPFFLAWTKEGIAKLEKFLEGKLNDKSSKSPVSD